MKIGILSDTHGSSLLSDYEFWDRVSTKFL